MKVIFLNIDGVLNTGDHLQVSYELWKMKHPGLEHNAEVSVDKLYDGVYMDRFGEVFDPRAVKWLHYLLAMTDAKIVIISPWKVNRNMSAMWKERGLPGDVYDMTPNVNGDDPTMEIGMWMQENSSELSSYVIIDSLSNYPQVLEDRLVTVDKHYGLNMQSVLTAINVLKQPFQPMDKPKQSIDLNMGEMD